MSSEHSGDSRVMTWVLSAIGAVALYLLSVVPFAYVFGRYDHRGWFEFPDWVKVYAKPYGWVLQCCPEPVQRLSQNYSGWWLKALHPAAARAYGL